MVLRQLSMIEEGWAVRGSDGAEIGKVVAVHEDHLVVEGGVLFKHDLYVPVTALETVGEGGVGLNVAATEADAEGWRYPPQRSHTRQQDLPPTNAPDDQTTTTMTGAGYGAGAGVSSAGPPEPGFGDAISDRLGGSGRAGLSGSTTGTEDGIQASDEEAAEGGDDTGDTSDDTSEGTSDDTSEGTSDDTSGDTSGGPSGPAPV